VSVNCRLPPGYALSVFQIGAKCLQWRLEPEKKNFRTIETMALELQNLAEKKQRLVTCDTNAFTEANRSFRYFLRRLKVNSFRHIRDLELIFEHPVTVLSGTNKVGKTSLLLLVACSFERFMKVDSTSPAGQLREHTWSDVLTFTTHENPGQDYSYELDWRVGKANRTGEGKRLVTSRAWSGLGKRSSDVSRINAKIRDREVRFIDLERVLPGRSFSNALYRKANAAIAERLDAEIEQAFAYVFGMETVELSEVGAHINKNCFLISPPGEAYSSYNAASGEEAVIYLLKDIIGSPSDSLILIDEIEAGFHPYVQRRLADIVQYISWRDKKQFIITTHSPTLLSAFPGASRRFIEKIGDQYRVINRISQQAASSKMDASGHPLYHLYCEDELAQFLIQKALVRLAEGYPHFQKLVDIIKSGPVNEVKNDYERHKRNFPQFRNPVGYCAVFDGDHKDHPGYSGYFENPNEEVLFLYPFDAPEKFLVRAYLAQSPNAELAAALQHSEHHALFQQMANLGLSVDSSDARSICYAAFKESAEYTKHYGDLSAFLMRIATKYSNAQE
jgi:predicted ATPase